MNNIIGTKFKEAFLSVMPITAIVVILNIFLPDRPPIISAVPFVIGSLLMIFGMTLYSLGADVSLSPMGDAIGSGVTKTKSISFILLIGFAVGFLVTVAEPDLLVLGGQLGDIKVLLILSIGVGVGLFLLLSLLRIFLKINLNVVLIALYALVFVLVIFVDKKYIPLSFDSGGVTTGAVTVPFIMALGAGVAGTIGGKDKNADSFGMVAICSVGPIFLVLLISLVFKPQVLTTVSPIEISSFADMPLSFLKTLITCALEVAVSILPIVTLFLILNLFLIKLPRQRVARLLFGILYAYLGLTVFLTGINFGFMPAGLALGKKVAAYPWRYLLVIVGGAMGAATVFAEPAVHVLSKQVETVSSGNIKSRTILISLSLSIVAAVAASMLRIIFGIPLIYILAPLYAVAILLTFITPKVYTAIAFDSGGVASGPMAASFMLPFAIGACTAFSGAENVLEYAYGLVAFIALTPLITIQSIGVIDRIKQGRRRVAKRDIIDRLEKDIVELF